MNTTFILLALALLLATAAIVGGLWVLARQTVVVDDKGKPTRIEVPFFGKLSTNYPSLVAIFLGALISYQTINKIPDARPTRELTANIVLKDQSPRHIFVHAIPEGYARTITANGSATSHSVNLEIDAEHRYDVLAYSMGASETGFRYDVVSQTEETLLEDGKLSFVLQFEPPFGPE